MADKKMSEKDYIKMLKKRDTPMAMAQYIPITEGFEPWEQCPVCGKIVVSRLEKFCSTCGQRFDHDNIQF